MLTVTRLFGCLALLAGVPFALLFGLAEYNDREIGRYQREISKMLPVGSDRVAIERYLNSATENYAKSSGNWYRGFVRQSRLDKLLMDRRLVIELHYDPGSGKLVRSNVDVSYTFL